MVAIPKGAASFRGVRELGLSPDETLIVVGSKITITKILVDLNLVVWYHGILIICV